MAQAPAMTRCGDLILFADGELEPARAAAFRSHLASCEACRARLLEEMQASANLGGLSPRAVSQGDDLRATSEDTYSVLLLLLVTLACAIGISVAEIIYTVRFHYLGGDVSPQCPPGGLLNGESVGRD
jgi:hypothetical protein